MIEPCDGECIIVDGECLVCHRSEQVISKWDELSEDEQQSIMAELQNTYFDLVEDTASKQESDSDE